MTYSNSTVTSRLMARVAPHSLYANVLQLFGRPIPRNTRRYTGAIIPKSMHTASTPIAGYYYTIARLLYCMC